MGSRFVSRCCPVILVVLCSLIAPGSARAQQSSSYRILRLSISPMAGPSASSSYRNVLTVSTVTGSSGKCPSGTVSTLGFWSILGAQEVPLVLSAAKDSEDPSTVVLAWSGQADEFTVYRSHSPVDLVAPVNEIAATNTCEQIDTRRDSNLYFYRVTPSP